MSCEYPECEAEAVDMREGLHLCLSCAQSWDLLREDTASSDAVDAALEGLTPGDAADVDARAASIAISVLGIDPRILGHQQGDKIQVDPELLQAALIRAYLLGSR